MTNEQAIKILAEKRKLLRTFQHMTESGPVRISDEKLDCPALVADQYKREADAYDLAIEALKNEPTDDDESEWAEYDGEDAGLHYCKKCNQQAFNFDEGGEIVEVLSNFCPFCGRPMKKRLEENVRRSEQNET